MVSEVGWGAVVAGAVGRRLFGRRCGGAHAYVAEMPTPLLVLARLKQAIDYGAPDGQAVDLVFLLAGPTEAQKEHLVVLARLARLLHDQQWLAELRAARTAEEALRVVREVERRHP